MYIGVQAKNRDELLTCLKKFRSYIKNNNIKSNKKILLSIRVINNTGEEIIVDYKRMKDIPNKSVKIGDNYAIYYTDELN